MSGSDRLRLRLLGRFAASLEGTPPRLVQISALRHRALLAYLAMQPSCAETRERLATLLWSDRPDKQARQSLRQLLLTLRQELESAGTNPLRVDRDTVGLDPTLISADARDLVALAQSDAQDIERGDIAFGLFLDGVDLDSETFEDWRRAERLRLETAAAGVFRRIAELADVAGDGATAVRAAERIVALDPLRESAQRLLLRLLAKYRGRDAALAQAERFAAMLREDMDAEPEPDTAALIAEIESLRSEVPAARTGERRTGGAAADAIPLAPPDGAPIPIVSVPSRQRRAAWLTQPAAGWAIAMLAVAGVAAVLVVREPPVLRSGAAQAVSGTLDKQMEAWRTPSILAGVTADAQALAAQAVYPIIVLPFTAESADSNEEKSYADRISDALISDLSRVPGLRVIARATSRLYAGRSVDVAAIGAELGVRYVVEGSVRLEDDRVRINAALIDPTSRLQVWSERFERPPAERFAAHEEIVRSIARHLHVTVFAVEEGRRGPPRAGDPEVDELLAKGWNGIIRFFDLGTTSGADGYFEEVLRRQPANGSAMLGLAGYKIGVVAQFLVPAREPYLSEADAFVARVLKANPRSHLGNYYRGLLHKLRGEPLEALAQFTKVLEMNPSFAPAYANAGHVMSRVGRLDESIEHVRYAIRLSPKDPNLGHWCLYAGEIELERRRDAAALEWLKRAVEIHPRSPFNHAALAAALALKGDREGAGRQAAKLREIAPWLTLEVMLERVTSTSTGGSEPHRLIEGLRKAFASPAG